MSDPARSNVSRLAAFGVGLLAVATAGYGIYLLIVGVTLITTPAVPLNSPPAPTSTRTDPVIEGWIPTLAGGLMLVGLALRRTWLTWAGVLVVSLFAALFVFSIGGILVPVAVALLGLLGVMSWSGMPRIRRSWAARLERWRTPDRQRQH